MSARFGSTYTKIGMIQRRLAWPLSKDDTQIREAFHIFKPKAKYPKTHINQINKDQTQRTTIKSSKGETTNNTQRDSHKDNS